MDKLLLALLLLSGTTQATTLVLPIVEVHDGDTIITKLPGLPDELAKVSVRILHIDTPELRGKCAREKALARKAKAEVQKLAEKTTTMIVENPKWDKFGGRIDGDVTIDGVNVAGHLDRLGLVHKFEGDTQKSSWCDIGL